VLTRENFQFARQAAATPGVAHLSWIVSTEARTTPTKPADWHRASTSLKNQNRLVLMGWAIDLQFRDKIGDTPCHSSVARLITKFVFRG
jgi:hypothetical protein